MHYKGKVVDSAVAPMTSTGKTVASNLQCEYTEDTKTSDLFDAFKSESDGKSTKSSY